MARVWAASRHSGTELLMLLAIADFADDDGNAYPSVSRLALKCRMKPRNANYVLAALRNSGELQVVRNAGPGGANRYRIVFSAMEGVQELARVHNVAGVQGNAATPAPRCASPLQLAADKPSEKHQEPSNTPEPRRARIPANWQPDAGLKTWFAARRPDLRLESVVEMFRNHYIGKGEVRASWDASFRTWVLRERGPAVVKSATSKHTGFASKNYREGIELDGTFR
jgi:hypothetical protein